ncbi:MAG: hypothetical protein NTX22_17930 [Ignavibacteriales bacterium]|nr:hypothetical protein [Ignavibacteriales bacterium]
MDLIPIIEISLFIFIGILIIVLLFSYITYKFGNANKQLEKVPTYNLGVSDSNFIRKVQNETTQDPTSFHTREVANSNNSHVPYIVKQSIPVITETNNRPKPGRFTIVNDVNNHLPLPSNNNFNDVSYKFMVSGSSSS